MEQAWLRLAEISNRIDMLEIALGSGGLDPAAEEQLRRELAEERRKLIDLEREVGLRRD